MDAWSSPLGSNPVNRIVGLLEDRCTRNNSTDAMSYGKQYNWIGIQNPAAANQVLGATPSASATLVSDSTLGRWVPRSIELS